MASLLARSRTRREKVLEKVHSSYNMKQHGAHGADFITSDFAHEFGIYGPPSYCVDRLSQLAELGVDRFILARGPDLAMPTPEISALAERSWRRFCPRSGRVWRGSRGVRHASPTLEVALA